ncbi:MAG: ABC transporter ATP-binding protein [Sarcina sp.]|nr:ABC transporter ATP-binding protein [Sarcina sp.]
MQVDIIKKNYPNRVALRDIHVEFPRGCASLIIGTSGAGKSTLIKCMIGMTSFDGEISDYKREDIAYIPQHPALNTLETARDAIYWSAVFSRLYKSKEKLNNAVEHYVQTMGLESVQNNEIKRLSGGQMQRVSIAKELIRGKNIIIADEIDTGLDCGVSRDLIKKLCNITHESGKTTIIISHNIVNIELYDRVVVLAKGSDKAGGLAYAGSPGGIRNFFGVTDYVDILTKINAKDEGGDGEADTYIKNFAEQQGKL